MGMRTRKEWYSDRVAAVRLARGKAVRLTGFDRNYLSFQLFWLGWPFYEPITALLVLDLLQDVDNFVDVGANIGYYSLTVASHLDQAQQRRLIAFEPNPRMLSLLKKNVVLNGLPIDVRGMALSDKHTLQNFYLPQSDMSGSLEKDFNDESTVTVEVPTTTLDTFVTDGNVVGSTLMKIDAEGHEPAILRGGVETLSRLQPDLIVEVTHEYDEDTVRLLRDLGYRFYQITDRGFIESDRLCVCQRDQLLFLNTLVSRRSPEEIEARFQRLKPEIDEIDLHLTSLHRDC